MTEQMITPEDVRVGDRIRVEWMVGDILYAATGTVSEIDMDGGIISQEVWLIGPAYIKEHIRNGKQITITLLSRPTPPLPTEVGSVIHVSECRGVECDTLAMLGYDRWWYTPVPVTGYSFHATVDITAWEPCNLGEVQG